MTNETTLVVRFHETGDASVLRLEEIPLVEPGPGEVRIRVEAIGLNRAEVMFREGAYLEQPEFPSRLGYEAAGVIEAIGADVSGLALGDRVSTVPAFSMGQHGVYGETAIVPAFAAPRIPDTLTSVQAASIWMQYITAFGGLIDFGRLKQNDIVLITAASSSVGVAAIQTAKALGATAVATTRSVAKRPFLLKSGADYVIVTDDENIVERILEITAEKGADLIFDPIGGPLLNELAEAAAPGATIIEYGALAPAETPFPLFTALAKGLSVRGYTRFELTQHPERLSRASRFILDGLESGALRPVIDRVFNLHDIADAHRYMESNVQQGKIVVAV